MRKKIKVVYDWMGPTGPICNGTTPNLYNLSSVVGDIYTTSRNRHMLPASYYNLYARFPDVFEASPSFSIKRDDVFIYEMPMYHTVQPERFFSYNDIPGIIETSHMSRHLLDCVRNGKGYILINNMFEALVFEHMFVIMHRYFNNHQIPLNKVIYQVGAANAEELYNKFCDKMGVDAENRMKVVFWDMVEWNISLSMHGLPYIPAGKKIQDIEKTFIVFNRRFRTHRTKLTLLFHKHNLLKDSFYSMSRDEPDGGGTTFMEQVDWSFAGAYGISREDVDNLFSQLPLGIDFPSDLAEMINVVGGSLRDYYKKSMVSVVTETFCESEIISVTEKTFKPLFYKQPFIIVGAPKALEHLRKKGYKTFSKWWDESYDDEHIPDYRIMKIVNLCSTINSWSQEQKQNFLVEVIDVLEHNYNNFLNRSNSLENSFWLTLGEDI